MSKTVRMLMTAVLAGAFLAVGLPAGALVAEFEWGHSVGNHVHFRPTDDGSWEAVPLPSDQSTDDVWYSLPEVAWSYNNPQLRGTRSGDFTGSNLNQRAPYIGEFIYAEGGNVFDLNPWYGMPGIGDFAPPDGEPYQFVGIYEFQVASGGIEGINQLLDDYGSLPASFESFWRIDLSNRRILDAGGNSVSGPENVLGEGGWQFSLNQNFESLTDWDTGPLTAWFEDAVYTDTWSGYHLLRDDDGYLTNNGYGLLATNNPALYPWLTGFTTVDIQDWDTFTEGDQVYQHVGVTGVDGRGRLEVVPEPTSMVLLGLGLTGFATRRLLSRKKKA